MSVIWAGKPVARGTPSTRVGVHAAPSMEPATRIGMPRGALQTRLGAPVPRLFGAVLAVNLKNGFTSIDLRQDGLNGDAPGKGSKGVGIGVNERLDGLR